MVHLVDNPKMRIKKRSASISSGQIREITKAVSQMIAITVAEFPKETVILLNNHGSPVDDNTSEKNLIRAIIEKVSTNDEAFNHDLENLILKALPELEEQSQYDNFGDATKLFGGNNSLKSFGGSSSGTSFLDGAKTIGTSTASGAAGGGIVGAALGAIGGIFGFANSAKQEKIEKEKASAMTLASMLQYKSAKLGSRGSGQRNTTAIIIAILAVVGIVITVVLVRKNKKAAEWKVEQA
ncbi:MAG: hypothetical protein RJQ00_06400 [Vicingaceae bacterium]